MLLGLVFFYCSAYVVAGEKNKIQSPRSPKILTFNPLSNNIGVNLDFSIPFINIPLNSNSKFPHNIEMALPHINIDPKSIAVGGTMVVVASVLASIFSKGYPHHRSEHNRREDKYMADTIMDMSNVLASTSYNCPSRLACLASRSSDEATVAGWKEIAKNKLLATMLNTTEVENAFRVGREGGDCDVYAPCPLKEEQLTNFMTNFLEFNPNKI